MNFSTMLWFNLNRYETHIDKWLYALYMPLEAYILFYYSFSNITLQQQIFLTKSKFITVFVLNLKGYQFTTHR